MLTRSSIMECGKTRCFWGESKMNSREIKAWELTGDVRISFVSGSWHVHSQVNTTRYRVNPSPTAPSCECEDFQLRGQGCDQPCKHILAVRLLLNRQINGEPNPTPDQIPQREKRKTYSQDWPNYNLAQTNERDHFQVLLADLCRPLPELPVKSAKGGRPAVPIADALFGAIYKVYSTFSARRFMCDLRVSHERGHIGQLPSYNSVLRYLELSAVTPILHDLIRESCLPLKSVETDFSVDSSGFSTSRFVRWFDEKYGSIRQKCDWVKCHLACGVKTNVVSAVRIEDKNAADCPQFKPLMEATAQNFTVKEASADKAYLSNANLDLIDGFGGTPYIPFKVNSQEDGPALWQRMFHYFNFRREEFLQHYHKRSNIESTFSMIKAKFRDHVRAKTDTAMKNEVLAKVICHNICCVISSWYELGIEPGFWARKEITSKPI
jgi:transposase